MNADEPYRVTAEAESPRSFRLTYREPDGPEVLLAREVPPRDTLQVAMRELAARLRVAPDDLHVDVRCPWPPWLHRGQIVQVDRPGEPGHGQLALVEDYPLGEVVLTTLATGIGYYGLDDVLLDPPVTEDEADQLRAYSENARQERLAWRRDRDRTRRGGPGPTPPSA